MTEEYPGLESARNATPKLARHAEPAAAGCKEPDETPAASSPWGRQPTKVPPTCAKVRVGWRRRVLERVDPAQQGSL